MHIAIILWCEIVTAGHIDVSISATSCQLNEWLLLMINSQTLINFFPRRRQNCNCDSSFLFKVSLFKLIESSCNLSEFLMNNNEQFTQRALRLTRSFFKISRCCSPRHSSHLSHIHSPNKNKSFYHFYGLLQTVWLRLTEFFVVVVDTRI